MLTYLARRLGTMLMTLFVISIISFVIIQLPPGDFVSNLTNRMANAGATNLPPGFEEMVRERYGLNQPLYVQYTKWMGNILLHGDFGYSFDYQRPASEVIADRMPLTVLIAFVSLMFTWIIALPVGIYSAVRKYSIGDYIFTFLGFIGLAVPSFLLALVAMYIGITYFDTALVGLFSPEFEHAPWSLARVGDLLLHLWIPVLIIGLAGTASLIRVMRANLLDELSRPYVDTARAKGMSERDLLLKYPVRSALNPFISTLTWTLPALVSGEAIVAIVLNLPTTGPVLLQALMVQDMYLAAGFILLLSALTVVGSFLSDLLLAWVDPRIRLQ
jgi:peptide/nickel transport system permease protein